MASQSLVVENQQQEVSRELQDLLQDSSVAKVGLAFALICLPLPDAFCPLLVLLLFPFSLISGFCIRVVLIAGHA